jgi:hypothetical protein
MYSFCHQILTIFNCNYLSKQIKMKNYNYCTLLTCFILILAMMKRRIGVYLLYLRNGPFDFLWGGGGCKFSVCSRIFFRLLTLFDFFVSQRTGTIFFVCMYIYIHFFVFTFFLYKIGNWTLKCWCKTLCSLNNERTNIPKIVVLYFFTPTPMMNMYEKKQGN